METYDSQFFDDDGGADNADEDAVDEESELNDGDSDSDGEDNTDNNGGSKKDKKEKQIPTTAASNNNGSGKDSDHLYTFSLERTDAQMPASRAPDQRIREQEWFIVVLRDLEDLVLQLRVSAAGSSTTTENNNNNNVDAEEGDMSHGEYAVIDGLKCAASEEMNVRLKRNCALLNAALKGGGANMHYTPRAAELITPALMPFVLSQELMCLCRATWNATVVTLRQIFRSTRTPPSNKKAGGALSTATTADAAAAVAAAQQQEAENKNNKKPLNVETGPNIDWRPLHLLARKLAAAYMVPSHSQASQLVAGLVQAATKMMPSSALAEIWQSARRHIVGFVGSGFLARMFPTRIFARNGGAADSESIREQCGVLREMIDMLHAMSDSHVPYPLLADIEEVVRAVALVVLTPVGQRLFEHNREAFEQHVVPLRKHALDLVADGQHGAVLEGKIKSGNEGPDAAIRVGLVLRKNSDGSASPSHDVSTKLLATLIVRNAPAGWNELTRWRRLTENAFTTKSHSGGPAQYLADLILYVSKYTQRRLGYLRTPNKPPLPRDLQDEILPALEGSQLQKFLGLTVPLIAQLAFNPQLFHQYSHAMWVLAFLDPTPATAARIMASVEVGMSESGKETRQVTQALKILSDQLCAITCESAYQAAHSATGADNVDGMNDGAHMRPWPELKDSSATAALNSYASPGDLQVAAVRIVEGCTSPLQVAKKVCVAGAFYQTALENFTESTLEDRVNDALRCIYTMTIFGQCDQMPLADRATMLWSFLEKLKVKYEPVQSNLSAGTAGILHYAFSALLRLVSDDKEETMRVVKHVTEMVALPAMHEVWTTFTRTMVAAILEAGSTHLLVAAMAKKKNYISNNNSDAAVVVDDIDIKEYPQIIKDFFVPFTDKIFEVTNKELANGLTTPSRFVGNIYMVCTLLEHLPPCVMRQLALSKLRDFSLALIKWCQEQCVDPDLSDKAEANIRCAASSIQSVIDVGMRALCRAMPLHPAQVTVGARVWIHEKNRTHFLPTTLADQRAARDFIVDFMAISRNILRDNVKETASTQERALQCCIAGRVIGGTRSGCWFFSASLKEGRQVLDAEIEKAKRMSSPLVPSLPFVASKEAAAATTTSSSFQGPSQTNEWWNARIFEVETPLSDELVAPVLSVDGKSMRDLTDMDTELYAWVMQQLLRDQFGPVTSYKELNEDEQRSGGEKGGGGGGGGGRDADDAKSKNNQDDSNSNKIKTWMNIFDESHPVCSTAPGVAIDDVPLASLKTVISLLESNYTFDYSGLLNAICAPGDDAGKQLYHASVGSVRLVLRARNRCGAFPRNSSRWSSGLEAACMFNLSFSKSLALRQQGQAVLVSFCAMWCNGGSYPEVVRGVVNGLRERLGMDRRGWLQRLSTVDCKAALFLIPDLIGVIGRDDAFVLADALLTELCLGGELPRPSNEQRKESKIAHIISKLNSTTYGPPAAECDKQVGRWLTLATDPNHVPLCVTRCLSAALCFFRTNIRIETACSVNMVSRQESLRYVTTDHLQFLLGLVSQLHRATTVAWKVLHMVGLVCARTMHFVHTHLPSCAPASASEDDSVGLKSKSNKSNNDSSSSILPIVLFHQEQAARNRAKIPPQKRNVTSEWFPCQTRGWDTTFGCAMYANHLQPSAACSRCYRANNTWALIVDEHVSELATALGRAFLAPEHIRACLDVHVSLLRSEAIAGERNSRKQSNPASSVLAQAIDWSRFARCVMWAQVGSTIRGLDAKQTAALEIKSMLTLTRTWIGMIDKLLPSFETASMEGRSPARSPALGAMLPPRTPVSLGLTLDGGPAVAAASGIVGPAGKSAAAAAAAAAASVPTFGGAVLDDKSKKSPLAPAETGVEQHADPNSSASVASKAAANGGGEQHSKQTTAICEFLAAAALLRGLHTMFMHLAFPAVPIESDDDIANDRADTINAVVALFRSVVFSPAVPQEAAELMFGPWNDLMGALPDAEKEPIVRYLIDIVTMSHRAPESINEPVRRRAWSALSRSHLSPSTSIWRETYVVREARLLHRVIVQLRREQQQSGGADLLKPAIEDQSRGVRHQANMVLREFGKSCCQLVSTAGYDPAVGGAIAREYPVCPSLLESDKLAAEVLATIVDTRFAEVDTPGDTEKAKTTRLRAALALIQISQSTVEMHRMIHKIPQIAAVLISVPSEAAGAGQLTGFRHPPFNRQEAIYTSRTIHAALAAELKTVTAVDKEPMPHAVVTARLLPMCVFSGWLAQSKYSCDMAEDFKKDNSKFDSPLDCIACVFALPGRVLMETAKRACSVWVSVLPRNEVRNFVIKHIKALDAAAAVKDTLTMKVGVCALSSVVNAFPEHVPAFVPAAVMKLVRYRNTTTMSHADEVELRIAQLEKDGGKATQEQIAAILRPGNTSDGGDNDDDSNIDNNTGEESLPTSGAAGGGGMEDYKSIATEGLQKWWASHLEAWEQAHKSQFTEAQAQAISDACKARSYFV